MVDTYFARISQADDGGRFVAGAHTAGPWAEHLQHGGPPNALAVAVAEEVVETVIGRADLVPLRLSADFVGPVPVGEIDVTARVIRAARSAALAAVTVTAAGRECLQARVWFVRASDTGALASAVPGPPAMPSDRSSLGVDFGYGASLDWRFVRGAFTERGPAAAWVCPTLPLMDGYELSGLARAVLIADSASGISAELDWGTWSFLNVDLDVHLARPVEGEWLLMEARTQLGPLGSALARSTLSDARGEVGGGLQTLVVAELPRR